MDFISEERSDMKNLFNRVLKRDFSGTGGEAIKNSTYQIAQNLIVKVGALLFTIVVARMLMPELMGLYGLALSTIVFFSVFSDLGLGVALFTFVARFTGRGDNEKAKGYFNKLLKWKLILLMITSIALLLSSYFISEYYYHKPIFYALLAGVIYIPLAGFLEFWETIFRSIGNFKYPLIKEIILQFLKLSIVPLSIFFLLKTSMSNKILIMFIIIAINFCNLVALFIFTLMSKKNIDFLKFKEKKLSKDEVIGLRRFILPLTATILSGVFFGYIDTIMLGRFVASEFLAYYGAAFALVSSASAIISFASSSLFPIFSRLEGDTLEKIFKKTRNIVVFISVLAGLFTYLTSYYLVKFTYGPDYLTAVPLLRLFSILIVILPITSIYNSQFIVQKRTAIAAKVIIFATLVNIVLNFTFITYGLKFGMYQAVLGACIATIISKFVNFVGLIWFKKK